eukprot:TRINITY_DN56705_c0_g1_i1.p1 TRINITY_DN56705_c0_g1~~TRINITY_DN56705_c0_g1_i1.p1  ORF type:complete len:402 (+),score=47.24 TRINITY_DN56705_c0_g1_i1:58-1263(+)
MNMLDGKVACTESITKQEEDSLPRPDTVSFQDSQTHNAGSAPGTSCRDTDNSAASLLKNLGAERPGMPVCLITGFLGAGKTTLVNHILSNSQGLRAAVFVNEFGSIDVDGALISSSVDEGCVISLTNGCVCCEVNADLAKQLSELLASRSETIDVVIIETSGVCDPDPVLSTLQQIEDVDKVHLDSVVCVVDATTVQDKQLGASSEAQKQLFNADVLLLNKIDLLKDAAETDAAEKALRKQCKEQGVEPPILKTVRAATDLIALCGLADASVSSSKRRRKSSHSEGAGAEVLARHGSHGHFTTFAYEASKPFDPLKFELWAERPLPGILRAKGLLWMSGIPSYVCFHLAGRRTNPFETLPAFGKPSCSKIVFVGIGRSANNSLENCPDASSIRQALDACLC